MSSLTVWTVGHSNRELTEFLEILATEQIESLADVRRFPGSRRHPHFGREALAESLGRAGIAYEHFAELGGRRTQRGVSTQNSGWQVAAFAAFADYMLTDEFASAFDRLSELATRTRTVIMCAEALPWRCHRRLIADRFLAHRWRVWDVMGVGQKREHALPPFARITHGQLTYPGETLFPEICQPIPEPGT
jgi:uncharacterized protein (DUF488 family)